MRYFVTGCAGYVGSNLVDRLLLNGHSVVGYDNFSTGQMEFIEDCLRNPSFSLVRGDALDLESLSRAMAGANFVFHLAANADVRFGTEHPRRDLEQNTIVTFNVLDAMRANGVRQIAFTSTASIYGEAQIIPTPEETNIPIQTSLYGAAKLASEGFIEAYCEGFDFQAWIFRFVSMLGERYTHGHIFDFFKQLRSNPNELCVLGDGSQRKSYLYVQDCIDAMLLAIERAHEKVNLFNLGTAEYCSVNDSLRWITAHLGLNPRITYSGGSRGWVGDNPFIFLDCSRIRTLGWRPKLSIQEGILRTLRYLQENPWVLDRRS